MIKISNEVKKHKKLRWLLIIMGIVIIGVVIYGAWYVNDYYKADITVATYLQSNDKVIVEEKNDIVFFKPIDEKSNVPFIFYPGGKVEYTEYAPLLKKVAEEGYFVALPKMTFNLSVLSSGRADEIMTAYPEYEQWVIGGHSLGGAIAADYALNHQDKIEGIVFWAAYPNKSLDQTSLQALCLHGTEDGFTTPAKIEEKKPLFPQNTKYVLIEGGNHSQFGSYGFQTGDGKATITAEEQQKIIVNETVSFLESLK